MMHFVRIVDILSNILMQPSSKSYIQCALFVCVCLCNTAKETDECVPDIQITFLFFHLMSVTVAQVSFQEMVIRAMGMK